MKMKIKPNDVVQLASAIVIGVEERGLVIEADVQDLVTIMLGFLNEKQEKETSDFNKAVDNSLKTGVW